jgi:hypothetical protein
MFTEALKVNNTITGLYCYMCCIIKGEYSLNLYDAVKINSGLKTLFICGPFIVTQEVIKSIANMIQVNNTLNVLYLYLNSIKNNEHLDISAIFQSLQSNYSISCFEIFNAGFVLTGLKSLVHLKGIIL